MTEPMRQLLNRVPTGHTVLAQPARRARRSTAIALAWLPTLLSDYTAITPEEMQALAARYLGGHGGWRAGGHAAADGAAARRALSARRHCPLDWRSKR